MKRLTALLLTAVISTGFLTGCNQRSVKDVETVRIWTSNSHSFGKEINFINNYNKAEGREKGIYIDYILKAYNLYEEMEKAVATGDAPEFSSWVDFMDAAMQGSIVAIDDLPGGSQLLREHKEKGLIYAPYTEYNGKIYALPTGVGTQGLIYNKDMFKAAGLVGENGEAVPPETLYEMRDYAKKLTNSKKGKYGIIFPMAWDNVKAYKGENSYELWFTQDIMSMVVASIGKTAYEKSQGLGEVFQPYMQTVIDMRNDGSIYPGAETMTNESARAIFSGGGIGMKISSAFDVAVFNYQFPVKDDWGVAPVPVLNKGERYKQVGSYNCTNMISRSALEKVTPEKLTEVLKLFVSDEYKTMLYEEGLQIPYGLDVSGISTENMPNGWVDFKNLSENSELIEGGLMAAGNRLPQIFVEDVFVGNGNLEQEIQKDTERVFELWAKEDAEKAENN